VSSRVAARDPVSPAAAEPIRLRGVRVHNLRGIDVTIPRNRLTVISGVSGSGKSSLAFDTLYAEGRRRYVECLSTYTQQFLERLARPDLDHASSLPPAVAMQRAVPASHSRSTVGTTTEIHDFLRLLFARVGRTFCLGCGRAVRVESPGDVADALVAEGGRGAVLFEADPPGRGRWKEFVEGYQAAGFARLWRDGQAVRLSEAGHAAGPVEIVADRLSFDERSRTRIAEAAETAYRDGHGRCHVRLEDGRVRRFSRRLHCPDCDRDYPQPEPNLFSPNSPLGACPECQGFGRHIRPDLDRIVPDRSVSLQDGAIDPWSKPAYRECYADLRRAGRKVGLRWDVAYERLPDSHRRLIEEGDGDFYGIRGFFDWLEGRTYKLHVRVFLSRYRQYVPCPACGGTRLRPEALAVRVGGVHMGQAGATPVRDLAAWARDLPLSEMEREIAAPILRDLRERLDFLADVGLGYLTLERPSRTLSGGEAQRIALARSIGTGLVDTLYVLDEPSVGLHPLDVDRLLRALRRLRDMGNTVVVVEHDARVLRAADWLVDLGPGAGEQGGRVVYEGPAAGVTGCRGSATGDYLSGREAIGSRRRRGRRAEGWIELRGARTHNLRDVDVRIPRPALTVVTGVSGSGKSSLVHDTLYGALARATGGPARETGPYRELRGVEAVQGVELVDQSPIGRTPRSNPVTYVKAFDGIRRALAATPEARARRRKPGFFSFNVPGGRCERCEGAGSVLLEMHFLADMLVPCEACEGVRYGKEALEARLRGRNVAEILRLTAREAIEVFADLPDVVGPLRLLDEIGLGYLRLGQPAPTLSGGEAQRLKLAAHLTRPRAEGGGMVFLLDEPTTGLHLRDVAVLVRLLDRLVEAGHTLVVVEHHLELIRAADWLIDLGPGAGDEGGRVVAQGTPRQVAGSRGATGRYLAAENQ
jgi:excinuclease ABC subunit A